ncbi:MAG: hypothetical protein EBZ77_02855 [Chitinophagia bacterium]|nr:hypothetical protein [Chitinophagia bacterium]
MYKKMLLALLLSCAVTGTWAQRAEITGVLNKTRNKILSIQSKSNVERNIVDIIDPSNAIDRNSYMKHRFLSDRSYDLFAYHYTDIFTSLKIEIYKDNGRGGYTMVDSRTAYNNDECYLHFTPATTGDYFVRVAGDVVPKEIYGYYSLLVARNL